MLPSFGSMSSPADVPHLRPAGSSPQLRVTFGAGFGSPSPVTGFGAFDCAESVSIATPHAPIVAIRTLDFDMAIPLCETVTGLLPQKVPSRGPRADLSICRIAPR